MSIDELYISTSLDQPLEVDKQWALERIEDLSNASLESKDPSILLGALRQVRALAKVAGLALAKGLHFMYRNWDTYEIEDDFMDYVFVSTGLSKYTIERYIRVWDMLLDAPSEHREQLETRNIKDLIPIANAVKQGYDIQEDDWESIVKSPDFTTVNTYVREVIKQKDPRAGVVLLQLLRDGTLLAIKNDEIATIGNLDINNPYYLVQTGIEKLLGSEGKVLRS